jgi:hypothetical protein
MKDEVEVVTGKGLSQRGRDFCQHRSQQDDQISLQDFFQTLSIT